jgi:hypothetical protein
MAKSLITQTLGGPPHGEISDKIARPRRCWRSTPPRRREANMLTTRDLIRIRCIIWKVRAWCWLVERLRARGGRMARPDASGIQKSP